MTFSSLFFIQKLAQQANLWVAKYGNSFRVLTMVSGPVVAPVELFIWAYWTSYYDENAIHTNNLTLNPPSTGPLFFEFKADIHTTCSFGLKKTIHKVFLDPHIGTLLNHRGHICPFSRKTSDSEKFIVQQSLLKKSCRKWSKSMFQIFFFLTKSQK